MKVSVIVPNYNHSKFLRERIDSILSQTYRDFELIILDDASTDNSREIILEYSTKNPQIITCFNEQNSGSPFKQWNKGVSLARGEYVWIAESDDYADTFFLERMLPFLEVKDIGVCFCDTKILNEVLDIEYLASNRNSANKAREWTYISKKVKNNKLSVFIENPIVNVSCAIFRRNIFNEVGGADITLKFCGDWLLYIKLSFICQIKYIPEPMNTFRIHRNSTFHNHYKDNQYTSEKIRVYFFLLRESRYSITLLFPILYKILKTIVTRFIFVFGAEYLLTGMSTLPKNYKLSSNHAS